MEDFNLEYIKSLLYKSNLNDKIIENILHSNIFLDFTKKYFDTNNNILDEYEDEYDILFNIMYNLVSIYLIIISQVHITLEKDSYRKKDENYLLSIYLMYNDLLNKNKINISFSNLYIIYQTYLYFEKYKYSNNLFYLLYKRFLSLYKHLIDSNTKSININDFFKKNINDNLNYELESFFF